MANGQNAHPAVTYIDRIVSLEEEVKSLREDIKDVYTEAKEAGHLKGAVRIVVKRKMENEDARTSREAVESEADQIMAAIGMLRGTPLGDAAVGGAGGTVNGSGEGSSPGYDAYQAGRKAGFVGDAYDNPHEEDDPRHGAFAKGWQEGQAKKVGADIKPAQPAKPDGRRGRAMSEEQKARMKAGRERKAAEKVAAAQPAAAE